jgi:hypothetical protein
MRGKKFTYNTAMLIFSFSRIFPILFGDLKKVNEEKKWEILVKKERKSVPRAYRNYWLKVSGGVS